MDKNELKQLLAGLSIAGLVAGATLTGFGCATA
jgi:radical SAM modification target selenobiotic family peptide